MASETSHGFFLFSLLSFFFFFFFFLSSFIDAKLDLHPSDLSALRTIQRDLGLVNGQPTTTHPRNVEGMFCKRRLSDNDTYVLRITRLVLNSKRLNGTLSPAVGRLTELKELSLPNNDLVDRIPRNIVHLTKLEILNLGNNQFTGEVPSQLSSLIRLRVLDVSSNKLSGNLNFLKYFSNLEKINIADNLFTGLVPASLCSFRNLRHFNFSGNRFLEGSTPLSKRLDEKDTVPKRFIFAESLEELNSAALSPGPRSSRKSKKELALSIIRYVAGTFAVTIFAFIFFLLLKLALDSVKGRGKGSVLAIFSPLIKNAKDLAFLEKDDGLANLEIIGRGGCGVVYKAELPGSSGMEIAIKKIIQSSKDVTQLAKEDSRLLPRKMRQIRSEINTVGQICRHKNLVPLLAYVPGPGCHYIVYKFMKNGSLQDLLNKVENGERELDWLSRHKIALGVAAGLEYLHMFYSQTIVHRDLKPANILLDDDMEGRISDFGLAKMMPDAKTHITASKVAGTVGYIAPECFQRLKFSEKSDIYSFGVVLGVLVMGKFPSDEFFQHTDEMTLVRWMRNVINSENPKRAIDARLLGNGYEEQMLLALKIACSCTTDNPKERPNSTDVKHMLFEIMHRISPINT